MTTTPETAQVVTVRVSVPLDIRVDTTRGVGQALLDLPEPLREPFLRSFVVDTVRSLLVPANRRSDDTEPAVRLDVAS